MTNELLAFKSNWFLHFPSSAGRSSSQSAQLVPDFHDPRLVAACHRQLRWMTAAQQQGGLGRLALARWAGWSGVQVGRYVKCWRRSYGLPANRERLWMEERREQETKSQRGGYGRTEWNRERGQKPLAREGGLYLNIFCRGPREFLVTTVLMRPVCLLSQDRWINIK